MYLNCYRKFIICAWSTLALSTNAFAAIIAGPMLGPVEMREASIWVQADSASILRVRYTSNDGETYWSLPVEAQTAYANTATLRLDKIEPNKEYSYKIELDGKLTEKGGKFKAPDFYHDRTPPPDFRIAIGGSHYAIEEGYEPPYQVLGGGYGIFDTILEKKPKLMIWAGNTAHLRQSDWPTQSGYLKRYTNARAQPQLQELLANVPQVATWALSDYSFNEAGKHYAQAAYATKAFKAFWPSPVSIPNLSGIMTRFRYADVDFIMLDVRSHRETSVKPDSFPKILGDAQIEWLRQELLASTATFKVVIAGAPILNPAENPSNLSTANYEQNKLLEMIRSARISGLFFISGGKSNGELTRLVHANSYNIYDLTVGPMTSVPEATDELNFFRMPGTNSLERQFSIIDFSGPENERQLKIQVMNIDGEAIWSRVISAEQLTSK